MIDAYLRDLEFLVNTDSGSGHATGVSRIASFFAERFRGIGFQVEEIIYDPNLGPCLEARSENADRFDVLLVGHMDTVFPPGTSSQRPFRIDGDRALGPGIMDMKGGLLLAANALTRLQAEGRLPRVCVAFNPDEEIGSPSSTEWLERLARHCDRVLVLEPARANGALVLERKGLHHVGLSIFGVAAHAGVEPEKGRSAIAELAHWILELHGLGTPDRGTTVNVGVVAGGTRVNVIAEQATAMVDMRFFDPKELDRLRQALERMAAKPFIDGVRVTVTELETRPPMTPSEATHQFRRLVEMVGKDVGIDVTWARTGGGSDGNTTSGLGIPTLDGFGPIGGNSHSPEEYLEVSSIEPRLRLLTELLARLKTPA